MSDFKFELVQAKKVAIPALIGLWGSSGSGKTYSAIVLARGLVGKNGKIAVIDTENQRAKFYSELAGGWFHCDMQPPFTPERYTAEFKECEEQGADVIIVDSMSHCWQGEGGILEQVDAKPDSSGLSKWRAPKMSHHRMTNKLLRSPIPVIFCIREKEGTKQIKNNGKTEIISLGPMPIAEKSFVYEMTIDLRMTKDGKYDLEKSKTIPAALRSVILADGKVSEEMGNKIAQWAGSGVQIEPAAIKAKQEAVLADIEKTIVEESEDEKAGSIAASLGIDAYKKYLSGLTADKKEAVKNNHAKWSKTAREVDAKPPVS